jgi:hypothetical protein
MTGFDNNDGNEDYKYYQSLSCLVLSLCEPYGLKERRDPYFYNKLQALLFDGIPNYDLMVDGSNDDYIIGNRGHASVVQFIGRNVALQTFGQSTGDISYLGNTMGEISYRVKETYAEIKAALNNKNYVDRKQYLINGLKNRIRIYTAPQDVRANKTSGVNASSISKIVKNVRVRGTNKNAIRQYNNSNNTRSIVPVGSGGGKHKTRKSITMAKQKTRKVRRHR